MRLLDLMDKKIINRGTRKEMNKVTINSREDKMLKSCYFLKTEDGKFFTDFMFSNKSFLQYYSNLNTPQTIHNLQFENKKYTVSLF